MEDPVVFQSRLLGKKNKQKPLETEENININAKTGHAKTVHIQAEATLSGLVSLVMQQLGLILAV